MGSIFAICLWKWGEIFPVLTWQKKGQTKSLVWLSEMLITHDKLFCLRLKIVFLKPGIVLQFMGLIAYNLQYYRQISLDCCSAGDHNLPQSPLIKILHCDSSDSLQVMYEKNSTLLFYTFNQMSPFMTICKLCFSNIDFPHEVTEHFPIDKSVGDKSFGIIDLSNTLDFFLFPCHLHETLFISNSISSNQLFSPFNAQA